MEIVILGIKIAFFEMVAHLTVAGKYQAAGSVNVKRLPLPF